MRLAREEGLAEDVLKRRQADARAAISRVIRGNRGLVTMVIKRYARHAKTLELADLVQAGNIGVMQAIERYDPDRSAWVTYAWPWIRQAVGRLVHDQDRTIRTPVYAQETRYKVRRAQAVLQSKLGRKPTIEEIAKHIDEPLSRVQNVLVPSMGDIESLDASLSDDGYTLQDVLADQRESAEARQERLDREAVARELMTHLTEKERRILEGRFWDEKTLLEMGIPEGVTRERIRQIEANALRKMRAIARRARTNPEEAA
jgi:RNA polymerase primary sigma factor